ncbi:trihelix transcription factor GT-3b-like [Neltuma alba]|uniref:trihelix transcription factor GT-3b-like n=1 Tax=Neltuma alba TaxID=207710 RepID=UPI0010A39E55|nr:trihelix transcription factor GT-3b-like [Prosopis alba]XP_028764411.1 trihelix transcription factor GT-3b-like [Prosopis alba]
MEGHHLHHHPHLHPLHLHRQSQQQPQQHHHQQQQQHSIGGVSVNVDVGDRFPQWSIQETKEFLMMRAELDQAFMETKRNKQLWEVISNRMKEKGYFRSPEQCKCKWKNLATRYKGCETMEPESLRQHFPFYNELQLIFTSRMQRVMLAEAEGGGGSKKKAPHNLSSDEEEEEDDNNNKEDSEGDQKGTPSSSRKKKKKGKGSSGNYSSGSSSINDSLKNMKEILQEFMRQQMQMEAQWMEAYEAREKERRMKELEWRQTMEALENEKIMMDQRWREREEQRRLREEARAEKRDALITALLNKLSRDDM